MDVKGSSSVSKPSSSSNVESKPRVQEQPIKSGGEDAVRVSISNNNQSASSSEGRDSEDDRDSDDQKA